MTAIDRTAQERKDWMAAVGEALYGYVSASRLMRHTNGASTAYYMADKDFGDDATNFVCDVMAWAGPKTAMRPGARERIMAEVLPGLSHDEVAS